jgi:hypothetical protein
VVKTVGSTSTVYVYDAMGRLAAEYGGTNPLTGTTYLTSDHLGSTRMVTNAGSLASISNANGRSSAASSPKNSMGTPLESMATVHTALAICQG